MLIRYYVGIYICKDLLASLLRKFLNFILYAKRLNAIIANKLLI